ncbi:flagellar M-ring protein [Kordiimonas sediminis]|uniref:Flagellar M-ring protein n=1 Tax=Kordiimonas sediminis TaxID=1735581 RepID=A0A919AQY5_9PROT|nr:flagellar basal-body MS-ring/collar protein FliF [Kordiimonas sediminis]GHF22616.1 flagellar M-ring protein [Kordiimonas sediminis]
METLSQLIRNLGTGRIIMIGLVGLATFAMFAFMIGRIQTAPMAVLYSDLEPANASTIIQSLEAQGVPNELGPGGRIISVPRDQVERLRLQFAGEGLGGSIIGKEIFDRDASFGRTSFELNVNYVRAVEGELQRTIKFIQSVSEARVHIVMPERRPFEREASEPSASILVRTSGGGLGARQAQAIQSLVASAIPGLSPDRVTISDTSGRLLTDGATESGRLGDFTDLEEARLAKEQLYRQKIENLLAQRVGRGNVRAEISIQMDMERTTTSQTIFDPDGQVIVSQTLDEESSNESETPGQVSVANNIPDADAQNAGAAGGPVSTAQKTSENTNFENSKTETVTIKEPGQVQQIRVSVIVDGIRGISDDGTTPTYSDRDPNEIEALRQLVLTAIPFDETRGDAVTVQSMRFADPPAFEPEPEGLNILGYGGEELWRAAEVGGLFILGILFILLVVRPVIVKTLDAIPEPAPLPDPNAQLAAPNGQSMAAISGPVTADIVAAAAAGDEAAAAAVRAAKESGELQAANLKIDSQIDVAQVEGRVQDSAIKKVASIIKSNPDDSTAIVRQWLYAD